MANENTVIINGGPVVIEGEVNLLELVQKAGIELPTFCYHSELSVYGACRMCLVEVKGRGLQAACSTPPEPGMEIETHTEKTQKIRRMVLELLLANHDRECTTCDKSTVCKLQQLSQQLKLDDIRFKNRTKHQEKDLSSPALVRDPNKCILCGDCVRMCSEIQSIGVLDFANRGSDVIVGPAFKKKIGEVDCVNCGQCAAVCPTGAITVRSQMQNVWQAIQDPSKTVVAQIAPAIRVTVGEAFGLGPDAPLMGKMAASMRKMGFDKVYDTCLTADLTILEETNEFLQRLQNGGKLPIFTSCCPGWVKFAEQFYPDLLDNLSTCRSPQQMFGSLAKNYYAAELGIDPKDLYVVSVMPCTAKKFEAVRPEFSKDGVPEVDAVLTTQELVAMIKEAGVRFDEVEARALDMPFGFATGAGVIFGNSGGVAEAVLRYGYEKVTGQELADVDFKVVRGLEGIKEAEIALPEVTLRLAVVSGLGNARELIERIRSGEAHYDIVEVMTCPGGCIGGGGQLLPNNMENRQRRTRELYAMDAGMPFRKSQDNPIVDKIYQKWLGEPNSHAAHDALHTSYGSRRRIKGSIADDNNNDAKLDVSVCVGTSCYQRGSYNILQTFMKEAEEQGLADKINLRATFCYERCNKGPSIKVNGKQVKGVKPDNAVEFFKNNIAKEL
ncbi:MAG: NADH-dependent [FeFe] hydrogenase, group A6 [bacterium]|nr:NADH-dependent [FeFe] hydrogenase, group A6 [bacterium]MDD3806177.1 NADH-dependent [FeFe] hydrogenase, group A6 [bacterium]MDD4557443.1 NADH-dependent [FeFe] hydrogenase, group A6 [bacterium]